MHLSIETHDIDEAAVILREQYTATIKSSDEHGGLRMVQDTVDSVMLSRIGYYMDFDLAIDDPMPATFIARLHRGSLTYDIGRRHNRWSSGDVFLAVGAGDALAAGVNDCDVDFAVIDPATFGAVARTGDGAAPALTGYVPVSDAAKRTWLETYDFARQVAAQPDLSALVAGTTARLVAATALAAFPNDARLEPTIEDRHDAHPPTLRRAVAYLESHPDADLSVVDIANAVYVTPRALQLAFRRHLDTTPLRYLRRVRLDRAHAELLAADPATATVTTIAARWGWARPGRFAAEYREAYGRTPSDTLST